MPLNTRDSPYSSHKRSSSLDSQRSSTEDLLTTLNSPLWLSELKSDEEGFSTFELIDLGFFSLVPIPDQNDLIKLMVLLRPAASLLEEFFSPADFFYPG